VIIVNVLFIILWIVVGFFILRAAALRFFREPRRADVAAAAVVVAFAAGALWPFSPRIEPASQQQAAAVQTAAPAAPAVAATAGAASDVSSRCDKRQLAPGDGTGSLDVLSTADGTAVPDGGTSPARTVLLVRGWAVDKSGPLPATVVCLIVDGKISTRSVVHLGGPRPDVATALGNQAVLNSAFEVKFDPAVLPHGKHRLAIAEGGAAGPLLQLPGARTVTLE
jgi:hypothetical protein